MFTPEKLEYLVSIWPDKLQEEINRRISLVESKALYDLAQLSNVLEVQENIIPDTPMHNNHPPILQYTIEDEPVLASAECDLSQVTNGYEFETYVANLLLRNGFSSAYTTQKSGDYGADILAEKDGIKYAIQCKLYSQPVGNKAVQEAYSAKGFYNCDVAVVATNSTFTRQAIESAEKTNVKLWGKDKILELEAAGNGTVSMNASAAAAQKPVIRDAISSKDKSAEVDRFKPGRDLLEYSRKLIHMFSLFRLKISIWDVRIRDERIFFFVVPGIGTKAKQIEKMQNEISLYCASCLKIESIIEKGCIMIVIDASKL